MVKDELKDLLRKLIQLEGRWHSCGSVGVSVLEAMIEHCSGIDVKNSVETGCGRSTIILSHISRHHSVFAMDFEGSISKNAASSELLNKQVVEFVQGPTQRTLPGYTFREKLQVAVIDGPHGYPFPDLEYFYIYPHLEEGGILIIDDIDIPTIRNMFNVLRNDDMFSLIEVVRTTAFLRRTAVPAVDPYGDGWWLQGFNRPKVLELKISRALARMMPKNLIMLTQKIRGIR